MKTTLAMIACLGVAGMVSAAASVDGNNTAVVIQKDVVKSSNGYQFLCVPVNGLSIAGGTNGTLDIATFLPVTAYATGTTILVVKDGSAKPSYELTETTTTGDNVEKKTKAWTLVSGGNEIGPGSVFWIKDPTSSSGLGRSLTLSASATSDTATKTTFCGQQRDLTATQGDSMSTATGLMKVMCNDGSTSIGIEEVAERLGFTAGAGDEIFVIQAGKTDYKRYWLNKTADTWFGWSTAKSDYCAVSDRSATEESGDRAFGKDDNKIAPGEAFYYHKK